MEETISRMAGADWGIEMTPEQFDDAIRAIGRTPAVRTTTYGRVGTVVTSGFLTEYPSGKLTVRSARRIDLRLGRWVRHDGREDEG